MTPEEAETALYEALGEPLGLLCKTNNFASAKANLMSARRRLADPQLDQLDIRQVALDDGNLLIAKKASPNSKESPDNG